MESSSRNNDRLSFGFTDLHSFKDYIVYVLSCAPDMFPPEDWRAPDDQMNLNRAFVGLRHGLDLTAKEIGESDIIAKCRILIDQSYVDYVAGRDRDGQQKLEEVESLLKELPSQ